MPRRPFLYRTFFRHVLRRIDAETAHALAVRTLRGVTSMPVAGRSMRRALLPRDEALQVEALGLRFPSPLGLAAGFDKDARAFESLASLGFGHVEVGTVTALPQRGNDRPRVFRLPAHRALVNRMGFPNAGAEVVADRLRRRGRPSIVGVNVGRSKVVDADGAPDDYAASIRLLAPHADYVVLNVSSPNTPGLRDLQAVDRLGTLVEHARRTVEECASPVPILVKIAPDLEDTEIDDVAGLALQLGVDGIIAVNTTVRPGSLRREFESAAGPAGGGLSGAPLKERALEVLRRLHAHVGGKVCLVSVGGIETVDDAWERIASGATLIQAYTGFVYGGPAWPSSINRGLARRVRDAGFSSIQDLVGTAGGRSPAELARGIGRPEALPERKHLDLGSRV